jgi:hypothetical protein
MSCRRAATAMPRPAEIEVEECARAERIELAFGPLGETGQTAFLAQRADAVAAAGQDLVRIALVADIPDQPVMRRVENVMDGNRQFDHAEPGAKMPAGARYGIDHLRTHLFGKLGQELVSRRREMSVMPSRSGVCGSDVLKSIVRFADQP